MQNITKEIDLREPRKLNIKPVWNSESKILMVGSITSIDGMKCGYYYSSRYNSFWKLLDFVVLSKKEGYTFDELETLFKTDNEKFKFNSLKLRLNQNYRNNFNNDELFKSNLKEIQTEFENALLQNNIAICDIFQSVYAKKGSSLDSDLILNDKNYPFETYETTINKIIKDSKVNIVVPNSDFVKSWLFKFKVNENQKVKIVQVASPSSARRLKLSVKFEDWKNKLLCQF